MTKRRLISLLPAYHQTDDLKTFFGATIDQLFQPGRSEPISGYIGHLLPDTNDFYVGEPSAERTAYQLEPGMVCYAPHDATVITHALTYPDLVAYLAVRGANVSNHDRLFDTDYYSYAPPINIDMLVNYRHYYWFGDGLDELPTLQLTVPLARYTGDSVTTHYLLPAAVAAVPADREVPTAFVDNVPVSAQVDGRYLVLETPPATGAQIIICRTPDLAAALTGQQTADVSDLNDQDITQLSSGMRVKIVDAIRLTDAWDTRPWDSAPWDASSDTIFLVDGVGQGMRLTPMGSLVRGLQAQYVTIDRSSAEPNSWSARNMWVHADSFAWAGQSFEGRQAVRPIIEFVRDLTMYPGQVWSESTDPLFMLYDLDGRRLDDAAYYPGSNFKGNRIFGFASGTGPTDAVLSRSLAYDRNGYILFSNDAVSGEYSFQLGSSEPVTTAITGQRMYGKFDGSIQSFVAFWQPVAQPTAQALSNGFYAIPSNLAANPDYEEVTEASRAEWHNHFISLLANQTGFSGNSYGANNYRDTARDLSRGTAILQHVAPLLKTMLLATVPSFDLPRAIHYAEVEYNRFRNKFVRKLHDLSNYGSLLITDDPSLWVSTALKALRIGHTEKFPFALSQMAGGQYFIPPTPTALGILPATAPGYITDSSTGVDRQMILGHDGSLTATFGDWRDAILLALETLIYDNLPDAFKTEARPTFDLARWLGGRFYRPTKGYSFAETTAMLAPSFELWAQTNRINYHTHDDYDQDDPFTWNYRDTLDRFGNLLPGSWRAVYRYYYGTDAPDSRPWEMLGFIAQPAWWTETYGDPPYPRSHWVWQDIAAGVIADGPRRGTDLTYQRSALADLLPIDDDGNLLDPMAAGIVNQQLTVEIGSRPWLAGDEGPIEHVWRTSPSARFALAAVGFLMKPARFVETCWDALGIGLVNQQWVMTDSRVRPRNALQTVHGELVGQGKTHVVGLSQWLADYLASIGQTSQPLGDAVRGLNVSLIHPMAGFVAQEKAQLVADSFGLLPAEDVKTILYASPAVASEVYSGVIIEWTGHNWRITGYDGRNPFFTMIPPNPAGPRGLISLATAAEPTIVGWRPATYYPVGLLVDVQNAVYECIRSHTSGNTFERMFWTLRPDLATAMIRAPRVVTYSSGLPTTVQVPYGTEFDSYQAIADFLLGYERWLLSRGWSFMQNDGSGQILNWSMAVTEFLQWAQIQWAPGNFIALSPGQQLLQFATPQGTILNVEDNITGFYGLIDRTGRPINQRAAIINRLDGDVTITAQDADIFLARLAVSNVEHALITSNVTIFNDDVYLPLYNLRQQRLRLITQRAVGWSGRMDAPGFVIDGQQLRSNFEKAAEDVRLMFDIEQADVTVLRDYARHVVGMQERSYLSNLLLPHDGQFELYQGMIQEKGAPGVFHKLARSRRVSNDSTLKFLEEWAFRIGRFGAPLPPFVTFQLTPTEVRNDPQYVRFTPFPDSPPDWIELQPDDARWYDQPKQAQFFPEQPDYIPGLPTAGPVRLDEVGNTVFHTDDLLTLYDPDTNSLPTGSRIWVYEADPRFKGTNWYVDAVTGDDNALGTSVAQSFRTLQAAHDASNPGDVINIASGSYSAASTGQSTLELTRSGTAYAPILYQAMPGATPVIVGARASAALHINASHVIVQGCEIAGWNSDLRLNDVLSAILNNQVDGAITGVGISIDRGLSTVAPHHVTVRNCTVHDFPGDGIVALGTDYLTIEDCTVYSNARFSPTAGSGISVQNSHGINSVTSYKTIVRRNTCFDNLNLVLDASSGVRKAGHGIALLDGQNGQTDGISYNGHSLIENNLCYNNGGCGIFISNYPAVDAIYNTCYRNQTNITTPIGEIVASNSIDCNIFNNIMVALGDKPITSDHGNQGVVYSNTLYDGGNGHAVPGIAGQSDPLFVAPNRSIAPDFRLLKGSFAIGVANPQFRTSTDHAGNLRSSRSGYDIGCFQTAAITQPALGRHPFTVLRSCEVGEQANTILRVISSAEDAAIRTTRLIFRLPITLGRDDVGNYLLVDGLSSSNPELQGLHMIQEVLVEANGVDLVTVSTSGQDFGSTIGPAVRVLRPVRFETFAQINRAIGYQTGDLVWIDDYNDQQWAVLRWENDDWSLYRQQPLRIAQDSIAETVIYRAGAKLQGQRMYLNQPIINDLAVLDPPAGMISNLADREIDYRTGYDPARYNAGFDESENAWGPNEVGKVWWDLSRVRFLDVFTDLLGRGRDADELHYRIAHWAQVAPNTSVDVYEWVESHLDPISYMQQARSGATEGTVYQPATVSYVQRTVYDPGSASDVPRYYFWVSGRTTVQNINDRRNSTAAIANAISHPASIGIPWMAAVTSDSLLVSGVRPLLDEISTVMKVRLDQPDSVGQHDEWLLLRPEDDRSRPPELLWNKLRDGLAGFAIGASGLQPVPDPALPLARSTGIDPGQSMFMIAGLPIPGWQANRAYYFGDQVSFLQQAYQCVVQGVSGESGPTGFGSAIEDGTVRWAYRGADAIRGGLLDARAAFIASVNRIFAAQAFHVERSTLIETIQRHDEPGVLDSDPNSAVTYLAWAQIDSSYPYEPPPSQEWDPPWQVHSLAERNDLLARDEFIHSSTKISVLLNGFANPFPQWSIWVFDPEVASSLLSQNSHLPPAAVLISNADAVFSLKPAFERSVANTSDLPNDAQHLERILVESDVQGFWAIYRWYQPDDEGHYELWRVQSYNTERFIEDVDWYAEGYDPANPPIVSYASADERDAAEGSEPVNRLVKLVADDSSFTWTAFIDGFWQTVADHNGTIRLSAAFYDPSRVVHGMDDPSVATIAQRDGSRELYVIAHALRLGELLTDLELNQVWFDMVNFLHVQQNEVDWAFKTSFMSLLGMALPLLTTPAVQVDQSSNVIDFINEVKPYHVKLRESAVQYAPTIDAAQLTATDFDNPMYDDGIALRALDPTDTNDQAILQTVPWSDWFQNFQAEPALIRSMTVTLLFDRLSSTSDNWDVGGWDSGKWDHGEADSGAAYRILTSYVPRGDMPPADVQALLGLASKANAIYGLLTSVFTSTDDAGTLAPESVDVEINPSLPSRPDGLGLRAPYYAADHPEERVPFAADDSLQLLVTANPLAGAPAQIVKVFQVEHLSGSTATLFFDLIAQSANAVLVYADGLRVAATDYSVDHLARTITINLTINGQRISRVLVHAFGFGGRSAITEQRFFAYSPDALMMQTATDSGHLAVVVNGSLLASGYTVSGNTVSLTSPPDTDSDVALLVYSGGASTAATLFVETLSYSGTPSWTLSHRDSETVPEHAGTIVEVNGLRLTPPTTFYGSMSVGNEWIYLPEMPANDTTVTAYVNGQLYSHTIPICDSVDPDSAYPFNIVVDSPPPTNIAGQFVLWNKMLVALDPNFVADVAIVLGFAGQTADYTVSNGVLHINTALQNSDLITVTTFSNAGVLGIQTVCYPLDNPVIQVIPQPADEEYLHVTMAGKVLTPDEYSVNTDGFAFGDITYFTDPTLSVSDPADSGSLVITVFTALPARELMMWRVATQTTANSRMHVAIATDGSAGFDSGPFDSDQFDRTIKLAIPTHGSITTPQPQYTMAGSFEAIRQSPYMAGSLADDLLPDDSEIVINLFAQTVASKLQDDYPLGLPSDGQAGAIWIDGERIEYFDYQRNDDVVTLSQLRRGTRGTSVGQLRTTQSALSDGSEQTFTFDQAGDVDVVIDGRTQPSDTYSVTGNTVSVTADSGSYIVVGSTSSASHVAGAIVWNGMQSFGPDVPLGPLVGNRELEPMRTIIAG